jgi:hypothetical protein
MKSSTFWNLTPCSPLEVNQQFEETCRHHLQGGKVSQARTQQEGGKKQSLLITDNGGYIFLRNIDLLSTGNTALYARGYLKSSYTIILFLCYSCILQKNLNRQPGGSIVFRSGGCYYSCVCVCVCVCVRVWGGGQ